MNLEINNYSNEIFDTNLTNGRQIRDEKELEKETQALELLKEKDNLAKSKKDFLNINWKDLTGDITKIKAKKILGKATEATQNFNHLKAALPDLFSNEILGQVIRIKKNIKDIPRSNSKIT